MNKAKSEECQPDKKYEDADFGYNLFPERKGEFSPSVSGVLMGNEGREGIEKMKCERTVYKCFMTSKY